jgi:hypothetical protein
MNTALLTQDGENNTATIEQDSAAINSQATINQLGSSNVGYIQQQQINNSQVTLTQEGPSNEGRVYQFGGRGTENIVSLEQRGSNNLAILDQGNSAVAQVDSLKWGSTTSGGVSQRGDDNTAYFRQSGGGGQVLNRSATATQHRWSNLHASSLMPL